MTRIEEIKQFIKETKNIQKLVYQLAFIYTSENPNREKAKQYLDELKEHGLTTESEIQKALRDVQRWRNRVLDKLYKYIIGEEL